MKTKKSGPSVKARLETGAAVIAAAQVTDVTVIKPRLTVFVSAHGDYVSVQVDVKAAALGQREAKADLHRGAKNQEAALEGVARALVIDGAPRDTPFAAFEKGAPFSITKLSLADQAMRFVCCWTPSRRARPSVRLPGVPYARRKKPWRRSRPRC